MKKGVGGRPKSQVWEYVEKLADGRILCKLCGLAFRGSGSRIKYHLYGIPGKGISRCPQFTTPIFKKKEEEEEEEEEETTLRQSNSIPDDGTTVKSETVELPFTKKIAVGPSSVSGTEVKTETAESSATKKIDIGPFSVSHHVSTEDLKLILSLFGSSSSLRGEGQEITVVRSTHFHLTRSDFDTLKPETCLDGNVINFVVDRLTDMGNKKNKRLNWFLPLTFLPYASIYERNFKRFVVEHNIKERYMSRLMDCEKIFVPIRTGSRQSGHFYLCVVHVKKRVAEIWDSAPCYTEQNSERQEKVQNILRGLDVIFMNEIKSIFPDEWAFSKFDITMAHNIPTQTNNYDCGIYVIKFMELAEETKSSNFEFRSSDEERLALALRLHRSGINQRRDDLHNAAAKGHGNIPEGQFQTGFSLKRDSQGLMLSTDFNSPLLFNKFTSLQLWKASAMLILGLNMGMSKRIIYFVAIFAKGFMTYIQNQQLPKAGLKLLVIKILE